MTTVISELVGVTTLDRQPGDDDAVRQIISRSPAAHRLVKALQQQWSSSSPSCRRPPSVPTAAAGWLNPSPGGWPVTSRSLEGGPMLLHSRSDAVPTVRVDVPREFHEIPLERRVEKRTASQLEVIEALGLSSPAQREAVSLYLEALSIRLAEGSVAATAFCAVRLDGRPSSATVTVALHETHTPDPSLAVLGSAEALRRAGRHDHVEILAVGGRPVAAAVAERPATAGDTPDGQIGRTLREITVLVPIAGHQHAVMVTLATPNLRDWETYRAPTPGHVSLGPRRVVPGRVLTPDRPERPSPPRTARTCGRAA